MGFASRNLLKSGSDSLNLQWNLSTLPSSLLWGSIAFGNGRFVINSLSGLSADRKTFYSLNGINWSLGTSSLSQNGLLYYGYSRFLIPATNAVLYSSDGVNWSSSSIVGTFGKMAFGLNRYVMLSTNSNQIAWSESSSLSWTKVTLPITPASGWDNIIFGGDKFIITSPEYIAYSTNGSTWSYTNSPDQTPVLQFELNELSYGNGKFLGISGPSSKIYYSQDGISFNSSTSLLDLGYIDDLKFGNNLFYSAYHVAQQAFAYSRDGIKWNLSTTGLVNTILSQGALVQYGNGRFVMVKRNTNEFAYTT